MEIKQLGHVVVKVRDRETAEQFYGGVLGLPIAARMDSPAMTFFSLHNHHDFAIQVIGQGPDAASNSPGLAHVAFKVGDSTAELADAKAHLETLGVHVRAVLDHTVSQSIYFHDPDGNSIELYVDTSDIWKTNPDAVATIEPLTL